MAPIQIAGEEQDRLTVCGARYKEKQSIRYYDQPCTVYLGPRTVCGVARGDYKAKGAVQMALDGFDCGQEEHPQGRSGWVDLFNCFMIQDTTSRSLPEEKAEQGELLEAILHAYFTRRLPSISDADERKLHKPRITGYWKPHSKGVGFTVDRGYGDSEASDKEKGLYPAGEKL
jgi:hypothetical protein